MNYYNLAISDLIDLLNDFSFNGAYSKIQYWLTIDPEDWISGNEPTELELNWWKEALEKKQELLRRFPEVELPPKFAPDGHFHESNYNEIIKLLQLRKTK